MTKLEAQHRRERIRALLAEGLHVTAIAERLGMRTKRVSEIAYDMGLKTLDRSKMGTIGVPV